MTHEEKIFEVNCKFKDLVQLVTVLGWNASRQKWMFKGNWCTVVKSPGGGSMGFSANSFKGSEKICGEGAGGPFFVLLHFYFKSSSIFDRKWRSLETATVSLWSDCWPTRTTTFTSRLSAFTQESKPRAKKSVCRSPLCQVFASNLPSIYQVAVKCVFPGICHVVAR